MKLVLAIICAVGAVACFTVMVGYLLEGDITSSLVWSFAAMLNIVGAAVWRLMWKDEQ